MLQARKSVELSRNKSNSIRGLSSIEFGNRTKSNTELCVSSISEPIEQIDLNRELNPLDCAWLGTATKLNLTQSNGFRPIVLWINSFQQRLRYVISKHEKHVFYWSNSSFEKLFNTSFSLQKLNSSEIKSSIKFDCPTIFKWLRFGSIAELSRTQFNLVRLSSIEIQFDLVRLTMPGTSYHSYLLRF